MAEERVAKAETWMFHPTEGSRMFRPGEKIPAGWADKPFAGQHPHEGGKQPTTPEGERIQQAERDRLQARLDQLEKQTNEQSLKIAEYEKDLADASKDFEEMEREKQSLTEAVAALQSENEALKSEIKALQAESAPKKGKAA